MNDPSLLDNIQFSPNPDSNFFKEGDGKDSSEDLSKSDNNKDDDKGEDNEGDPGDGGKSDDRGEEGKTPEKVDNDNEGGDNPDDADDDSNDEGDDVISILKEEYGIEDGEYEDSIEGLKNLNSAIIEKQAKARAEEQFESIMEAYPDFLDYVELRKSGYTPEQVYKMINESQLPESVVEDNTDQQKAIHRLYFSRKGLNEKQIDRMIKTSEADDALLDDAKSMLDEMKQADIEAREKRAQAIKDAEREEQERIENYWRDVENKVMKEGKIHNINIPEAEKKAFFEYISKPVNRSGETQEMLDRKEMPIEDQLALRFFYYKKFNLSTYINDKAKSIGLSKMIKNKNSNPNDKNRMSGGQKKSTLSIDRLANVKY